MTDCTICCEKFNLTCHKKVECNYCELECCRKCIQKYLTDITTDAHCMQCKNIWNREFIDSACTKHFRNKDLKIHRENILFEREKCFLPDAQVIVARRKEKTRLIEENKIKIREFMLKVDRLERENAHILLEGDLVPGGELSERRKFIRKCPVSECRGFLSTQWKCELCENRICHECNEVKEDPHVCEAGAVETMKLLKKDTKACPNCGTMIFKISGCAQMWCPDCHTAFNWNTMQIEKGIIHNPHFYEFQRLGGNAPRNAGDIPCGGMPDISELYTKCKIKYQETIRYRYVAPMIPLESKIFFDFHRIISHINQMEIHGYRVPCENNTEMRIKYLTNSLTEDEYKFTLQKNEKAREKRRDILNILTMFTQTGADILRQFVNGELLENGTDIIHNLRDYTNETLCTISKRYSCVVPQLNIINWDINRLKF